MIILSQVAYNLRIFVKFQNSALLTACCSANIVKGVESSRQNFLVYWIFLYLGTLVCVTPSDLK